MTVFDGWAKCMDILCRSLTAFIYLSSKLSHFDHILGLNCLYYVRHVPVQQLRQANLCTAERWSSVALVLVESVRSLFIYPYYPCIEKRDDALRFRRSVKGLPAEPRTRATIALDRSRARAVVYHQTSSAAAATVLLYDILLNLATEIEVIWRSSWSLPKILYLIARYWAPLDLLVLLSFDVQIGLSVPRRCRTWLLLTTIPGPVILPTVVNIILILRMHALYDKSRKVLVFMCTMMFCGFGCTLGAALWASVKAQIVSVPSIVRLPACATVLSLGNVTLVAWVTSIVIGFTCMMMTLYKYISALGFSWRSRNQMSPLLRTIIRDGVLYWFLIFAADLFDALLTLDTHTPITRVGAIWFIVVYSIAGTRILLNLRAEAQKSIFGSQGSTTQPTEGSLELEMFAHQQSV
ncbi:hypothetical protein NM688_g8337 [Phlebia brevispora]|uniref:Uncharacterized protein n=1 Tax=Phlebia brevispora TaxID=194682 RepID=A0ACC1RTZ7_9APHY|nr:hypothetical protein NM688_g8337 [Phlebia brevispora]